jgi:hypothetical protein
MFPLESGDFFLITSQRKIPRHEYTTATSWGQDVELIFQNAATYNEDGSLIVTQAKALQVWIHFHKSGRLLNLDTASLQQSRREVPSRIPGGEICRGETKCCQAQSWETKEVANGRGTCAFCYPRQSEGWELQ